MLRFADLAAEVTPRALLRLRADRSPLLSAADVLLITCPIRPLLSIPAIATMIALKSSMHARNRRPPVIDDTTLNRKTRCTSSSRLHETGGERG
jgi:hypothetical protein